MLVLYCEGFSGDSLAAETQKQAQALVVRQRLPLPDNGSGRHADDLKPMNEERAIVVAQQSMDVDDYVPPPPLRIVRPESLGNGQEECPGFHYEEGSKKARTKNTSTSITYTRTRGRPSTKSKNEQKAALFDSSCGTGSYSKGDKDDDFKPPTPMRKRGRPSRSKSAKRKMEQEPPMVDSSSSSEGKKDKDHDFEPEVSDADGPKKYACVKGSAWDRAKEVKKKLPAAGPSFVRIMLHSHVVKGFWLGLPTVFCRNHLPDEDADIVLEDEEGQTYETIYKAYKTALSGGWMGFAKQHDLKVGDALVFQRVQPTRFKVYILRENKFTTTDGALGLLGLNKYKETNTSKKEEKGSSNRDTKSKEVSRKKKRKVREVVNRVSRKPSNNYSGNLAREEAAGGGIPSPGPDTGDFVAVKSPVNFKIIVGDGPIALPDHVRIRYSELCHARKALLHRHLPEHICHRLAGGMIVQTVNIAEGIMASSAASLEDFVGWKKTLESLESLGMDVAFMIERVDGLICLLNTPSSTMEEGAVGYKRLKLEQARLANKVRYLESRLSSIKDGLRNMDAEMEEESTKRKDRAVRKLATTPW